MTLALTRRSDVESLVRLLVGGRGVVAVATIYESRTGYNSSTTSSSGSPSCASTGSRTSTDRGGGARAYASGQHPIAMGAALMMLVPLGIYLVHKTAPAPLVARDAAAALGALATKSRTAIVMLVLILVAMLDPQAGGDAADAPAAPAAADRRARRAAGHDQPFKNAFLPSGGIVAQETSPRRCGASTTGAAASASGTPR